MSDLKNIAKVFGILLIIFGWFFYEFRLYETDDDVKKQILDEEVPKAYVFRVVSCKEYRGFSFVGVILPRKHCWLARSRCPDG